MPRLKYHPGDQVGPLTLLEALPGGFVIIRRNCCGRTEKMTRQVMQSYGCKGANTACRACYKDQQRPTGHQRHTADIWAKRVGNGPPEHWGWLLRQPVPVSLRPEQRP